MRHLDDESRSERYQARERFEIQLVQHLNDLYDAQQRHHEEALRLMTERRAGLAKAQTYMQATKGVMSRRQTQLAQISQQLEEEIKDINEHEEAGRAERKIMYTMHIHIFVPRFRLRRRG